MRVPEKAPGIFEDTDRERKARTTIIQVRAIMIAPLRGGQGVVGPPTRRQRVGYRGRGAEKIEGHIVVQGPCDALPDNDHLGSRTGNRKELRCPIDQSVDYLACEKRLSLPIGTTRQLVTLGGQFLECLVRFIEDMVLRLARHAW